MISIQFRKYDFHISHQGDKPSIFDEIRKKNVILTPEEWVRQNFLHYLIYDLGYKKSRIAVEREFKINGKKKRFDILVYNEKIEPFMLIECKSQKIKINGKTAQQVVQYNLQQPSTYLVLTNGNTTFCYDTKAKKMISEIPLMKTDTP